jgi:histidinol dehydrogenase
LANQTTEEVTKQLSELPRKDLASKALAESKIILV